MLYINPFHAEETLHPSTLLQLIIATIKILKNVFCQFEIHLKEMSVIYWTDFHLV